VRYDTKVHRFRSYEYAYALFAAIRAHFPYVLAELRDLPHEKFEGIHIIPAVDFGRISQVVAASGGRSTQISADIHDPSVEPPNLNIMKPAVIVDDGFGAGPHLACVVTPPVAWPWFRRASRISQQVARLRGLVKNLVG
jgi:hypothetical protein